EQRHERRDDEQEDDVRRRAQQHPREEREQRQGDKLHPARHHQARWASDGAHGSDATAPVVRLRSADIDWPWPVYGSLALKAEQQVAPLPRMPTPVPHRRPRTTRRRQLERERRLRRLAVLLAIALVALVTVLLSAFGGSASPAAQPQVPASASRLLPAGPPQPELVGRVGALPLRLPVAPG